MRQLLKSSCLFYDENEREKKRYRITMEMMAGKMDEEKKQLI